MSNPDAAFLAAMDGKDKTVLMWQSSPGCGCSTLARAFGTGQADPHVFAAPVTCGPMQSPTGAGMLTWTTNVQLGDYALMSEEFIAAAGTTELVLLVLDARKVTVVSLMQTLHECGNFSKGAFAIVATHAADAPAQALKDLRDCLSVRPMKKTLVLLDDARDAAAAKAAVTKAINIAFQRAILGDKAELEGEEEELDGYMNSDDEAALPRERPLRIMLLGEPASGRSTVARSAHDGVESDLGLPNTTRVQMSFGGGNVGTLHLLDQDGTPDFATNFADVQACLVVLSLAQGAEGVVAATDRVLARAMQADSADEMHDILVLATHKDAPGADEAFAALKAHLQTKGEESGGVGQRVVRVDARNAKQVCGALRRLVRAVMLRQTAPVDNSASGDEADEILLREARTKVAKADKQRAARAAAKQRHNQEIDALNALMDQLMPGALDAIDQADEADNEADAPAPAADAAAP